MARTSGSDGGLLAARPGAYPLGKSGRAQLSRPWVLQQNRWTWRVHPLSGKLEETRLL